jgi:hypothetical protein
MLLRTQVHLHAHSAPHCPEDPLLHLMGVDLCTPLWQGGVLPVSLEDTFSPRHTAAPQRPCSKRIGNVITTVFISKRTAGSLLLSIWTDPDGYSWNSLLREQPCLELLIQFFALNLAFFAVVAAAACETSHMLSPGEEESAFLCLTAGWAVVGLTGPRNSGPGHSLWESWWSSQSHLFCVRESS